MSIQTLKTRHVIERSDQLVRVTLPTKKDVFLILFACFWGSMWAYMAYVLVRIAVAANKIIQAGQNSASPVQSGGAFFFVVVPFFLVLLISIGFSVFSMYRFVWFVAGKEVFEATSQTLRITKQIFRWKRSKEYPSQKISDLRTNTQALSIFLPGRNIKRFLGGSGMIIFDYGRRTPSFGLGIDEIEAEQIIHALRQGLSQENAG